MLSKKKKGFRKISIEGKTYFWNFSSVVDIRPDGNRGNRLCVDFGYYDEWLYVNDAEQRPADFEPKSITPAFVKECVQNAISLGWDTEKENGTFKLNYSNGVFEV